MKYQGTLLVVKNVEVSKNFYQNVMFSKITLDLGEYVVFENSFSILSEKYWKDFWSNPKLDLHYRHNTSQLGFEVEDIDAFITHLTNLNFQDIFIADSLKEYPWGQRSMKLYDPDMHLVEVGEDMKVVTKRFLQSGMSLEETVNKVMYPREFVEMCQKELLECCD